MLIPLTVFTSGVSGYILYMLADGLIRNGCRMGPTGKALTKGFLTVAVGMNVPTVFFWLIFLRLERSKQTDETH